jgi:hypothetical protein
MDANIEIDKERSRVNRKDFIDSSLRDLECAVATALTGALQIIDVDGDERTARQS